MTDENANGSELETTRRNLMKQAATTAAVGVGATSMAGSASAEPLRERYADPLHTEMTLESHASDLLAMLSADGLLETGDLTELHTRRPMGIGDVGAKTDGTAYIEAPDAPDEIVSVRTVEDGVLTITVEPETGRAYATHDPNSEDARYLYEQEQGVRDVETECSAYYCECLAYNCEHYAFTEKCTYYCGSEYTEYYCDC